MGHNSSKHASESPESTASDLSRSASTTSSTSSSIDAVLASSSSPVSTTQEAVKTEIGGGGGTVPDETGKNTTDMATEVTSSPTTDPTSDPTSEPTTSPTSQVTDDTGTTKYGTDKPADTGNVTKHTPVSTKHTNANGEVNAIQSSPKQPDPTSTPFSPAKTEAFTEPPPITLSTPVISTSLDTQGNTFIVTPGSITLVSTSVGPDGSYTFTQVAPNPTAASGNISDSESKSFFDNTGAKAGVFTALAIALAAVALALFLLCRRRRRRRASSKWWMHKTPPEDPFSDSNAGASPNMAFVQRSIDPDRSSGWSVPTTLSQKNTLPEDEPLVPVDPFNGDIVVTRANAPSGRSTPSAYPPSLYDSSENHSSEGHHGSISQNLDLPLPLVPLPVTTAPPPRPARSILRELSRGPSTTYIDHRRLLELQIPHPPQRQPFHPLGTLRRPPNIRTAGGIYDIDEREVSSIEEISRRPTLLGARVRPTQGTSPALRGFGSSSSSDEY
ncbi:hypothetical protein DL96DRAFT_33472 [Flagelloscypha sp. PMI_526]|nr:hypothetical protein DL96DRAFT_33472 [Flagelloscypha sp. PMI_526]